MNGDREQSQSSNDQIRAHYHDEQLVLLALCAMIMQERS